MPLTAPTYGGSYNQTEHNTNSATICGFIDTNIAADAVTEAALLAWFAAAQNALLNSMKAHGDGTDIGKIQSAYAALVASLAP